MAFSNFFLFPVAQEYHNKWAPALNGQKKLKTSEKLQKITNLQTPDWIQPNWMTLYYRYEALRIIIIENISDAWSSYDGKY